MWDLEGGATKELLCFSCTPTLNVCQGVLNCLSSGGCGFV